MIDGRIVITDNRLLELIRKTPVQAEKAIEAAAQEGRNYVVLSLQERSPGEEQIRYNPRRTVVAAAEGETPNTDTGTLVNSINVQNTGALQREIAAGTEYAAPLELVLNRPFMMPMALWLEEQIPGFFDDFFGAIR